MRGIGLVARYQRDLDERHFTEDSGQLGAIATLDELGARLAQHQPTSLLENIRRRLSGPAAPERGLYLWGGVGRGKTYLMDLFYELLPFAAKRRSHFHRFMQDIHAQLGALGETRDPLPQIAAGIAAKTRILCFDEFYVADIGDAMILGNLLAALFDNGVTLVATSNVAPHDLYHDGLQRQRFMPAIELLQKHTQVMEIGDGADYRLRVLQSAEIYHSPLDRQAAANLQHYMTALAPDQPRTEAVIEINGRDIATRQRADGVAWFDFDAICTAPRSAADYLEIARLFHTVLLSDIPILDESRDDDMRRFIGLVDVFYDHRVKLILSAAAPPDQLYVGERLAFECRRTRSRLTEMQTTDYLALPHLP
ncbi:MAG: AFG1 family ATPase [Gammaproteobacteria bacterium]|nr:AFG1 family ATPase [Gammaproteobacteria bacterium]NNF61609.1 cell division protein ZapE [Gammaproteobacteria bacterium]